MSIAQGLISGYNLVQGTKQFNENARLREKQLADNAAYREAVAGITATANPRPCPVSSRQSCAAGKNRRHGRHLQNAKAARRYSG